MATETTSKMNAWMTFVGVILLLVGVYASIRTIINITAFAKYPTSGVLSINLSGQPIYQQREQDCMYTQLYYEKDGVTPRQPTEAEKEQVKQQQQNCLSGIEDARQNAKVNDISQSLLFLFMGIGVLVIRKIFFK